MLCGVAEYVPSIHRLCHSSLAAQQDGFRIPHIQGRQLLFFSDPTTCPNPAVICTGDPDHLCNLLLVAQYCCFASNLSGAWHFVGLAFRLAVELGLHDTRAVNAKLSRDDASHCRWLFWACYTLERNLCVVVGRPFSIPDEAIHTPLPELAEGDGSRALALHLIKHRKFESEIYTTLNQKPPVSGAAIDLFALAGWHET